MQQKDLTPEYLTRVLQSHGLLLDRVVKVEFEALKAGQMGMLSNVLFVTLTYDGDQKHPPTTMAVKWHGGKFDLRLFFKLFNLAEREIRFLEFNQTQPLDKQVATPQLYHSELNHSTQDFVLLMQDLRNLKGKPGSQMEGVSLMEAKRACLFLARLHAIYWESYSEIQSWAPMPDCKEFDFIPLVLRDSWPKFLKWARGRNLADLEDVVYVGDGVLKARNGWRKEAARPPLTLLHGDCHCENFIFLPGEYKVSPEDQDPAVYALDFQLAQIGQSAFDVAGFMVMSLSTENFNSWSEELLQFYFSALQFALRRLGKAAEDFTFPQFKDRFSAGLVSAFMVEAVGQGTMSSKELADAELQKKRETVFARMINALRSYGPPHDVTPGPGVSSSEPLVPS